MIEMASYKTLIRPHLEYVQHQLEPTHLTRDIANLEKVHRFGIDWPTLHRFTQP